MTSIVRPEATLGAYGDINLDRDEYCPLDTVEVTVVGRAKRDDQCFIRVEDSQLNVYFEAKVRLKNNRATVQFQAAGKLGTHWVYMRFTDNDPETPATACIGPDESRDNIRPYACPHYYAPNFGQPDETKGVENHVRYANFILDAGNTIESGDPQYDSLPDITRRRMTLNRRVFNFDSGPMAYYCSADTWCTSNAWLRDWIYQVPATRFWERELVNGVEEFTKAYHRDGAFPDMIRIDGSTCRQPVESDAEYVAVMAVWEAWRVTADHAWVKGKLPMLDDVLTKVRKDSTRWDDEHQLVVRAHTCDTWDFEIGGGVELIDGNRVIANCDQSGYHMAYVMMAQMYKAAGDEGKSTQYEQQAEEYRDRANKLLWDGVKYQHHIHMTPMEHPGFDETDQLTAGNTWAMTRGLAHHEQAVSIIDEYHRRQELTGDAYPWWSMQPGYPDDLNYWPDFPHCAQGAYANGGLLPYVGAELCRACFMHGREAYGLEILQQYLDLLANDRNRVYVWYWPNGEPGMRTANEVPRAGWGMAEWYMALLEGLAGVTDTAPGMASMRLTPRWVATDRTQAYVSVRYTANDSYFAYRMTVDKQQCQIVLEYTGSGETIDLHVLLPGHWTVQNVTSNDDALTFTTAKIEQSQYVDFADKISGHRRTVIQCEG